MGHFEDDWAQAEQNAGFSDKWHGLPPRRFASVSYISAYEMGRVDPVYTMIQKERSEREERMTRMERIIYFGQRFI